MKTWNRKEEAVMVDTSTYCESDLDFTVRGKEERRTNTDWYNGDNRRSGNDRRKEHEVIMHETKDSKKEKAYDILKNVVETLRHD